MDIKTLFISIFVVSATGLMLSIFIYRKVSYVFQGSIYWLLAVISIFSSTFFFSMVKTFPAFFAVHIGNTLFLSSPILITISFHRFFFQTNPRIPIFTGIFLIIVFNILAPFASVKERIILFSAFFTILWTFPGLVLITLKEDAFNKLLAGTFFLIAGISLYRAVGTYLGPDIDNLLVSNITQQISIVSILVTWVIIITAFLLLINSHAIDRIAEEERKLKIAVEQNPQSISISDLKGIILSVNKAFCDTSGYKQEELIGQNYRILKSGVHNPQFYEEFWKIILQGKPWIGEICNKKKDGTIFWEKATVSPIFSKQNEVTGFFAIKEDITRQKHLEKFKNRMESLMRHDLKTPLNGIINFPDIILDEGNLSSEQIEYLQFIKKSGKMMLDQIEKSLDLYKLEEGIYKLNKESVDLEYMIEDIEISLNSMITDKQLFLTINSIYSDVPEIFSDKILVYRLLSNLIKNALEAAPPKTTVSITIDFIDEQVVVTIHNLGEIPEEIKENFFQKYMLSSKEKGTGLGTYSSKLIADRLNFGLSFESTKEAGTKIKISIPLS